MRNTIQYTNIIIFHPCSLVIMTSLVLGYVQERRQMVIMQEE
jgi:hypothetical protein